MVHVESFQLIRTGRAEQKLNELAVNTINKKMNNFIQDYMKGVCFQNAYWQNKKDGTMVLVNKDKPILEVAPAEISVGQGQIIVSQQCKMFN